MARQYGALRSLVLIALCWLPLCAAQVFKVNTNKQSYDAATDTVTVQWSQPNGATYSHLSAVTLLLCTFGSNGKFGCPITLTKSATVKELSYSAQLTADLALAPSGSYVVQLTAVDSTDAEKYVVVYGDTWITLSGMTGAGSAESGSTPSDTYNGFNTDTIQWSSYTLPASLRSLSSYEIPYTWQKGPTRAAPFQSTPGTVLTVKTTPTNRNPTSSVSIFTTVISTSIMPITTVTPSPVSKAILHANYVSAFSTSPSGRSANIQTPSLSTATTSSNSKKHKRRRWID